MGAPSPLPPPSTSPPARSPEKRFLLGAALTALALTSLYFLPSPHCSKQHHHHHKPTLPPVSCPAQPAALSQPLPFDPPQGFKAAAAERWAGAVRVPTPSYDDFGEVGVDGRYEVFPPFAEYLRKTWPEVHEHLELEKVNTHGLLYTWPGSDPSLKPLVLMAHQDVVPVPNETVSRWTYPPFSGHIDEYGWVWGRGVGDCKMLLTAIFDSLTLLLSQSFTPRRTVIISLGFDEEISGPQGARRLAERVLELYGQDGVFLLVDEGGGNADGVYGQDYALPAMGEKGYLDVTVSVALKGGHSSVPPEHTSIGILAQLVSAIEANPHSPSLSPLNPFTAHLQCLASHSPSLPSHLRDTLLDASRWGEAAELVAATGPENRYLLQTSQAVDLISGGVKINALPEIAQFTVNQRISAPYSVALTKTHLEHILRPVTEKFNLTFLGFSHEGEDEQPVGSVKLKTFGRSIDPAPLTPREGGAWEVFAGTVRHVFGEMRVVSPFISTGNTDTRWYWNSTRAIYRYQGASAETFYNAHTVDERAHIDGHYDTVRWVHALVQGANGWEGEE